MSCSFQWRHAHACSRISAQRSQSVAKFWKINHFAPSTKLSKFLQITLPITQVDNGTFSCWHFSIENFSPRQFWRQLWWPRQNWRRIDQRFGTAKSSALKSFLLDLIEESLPNRSCESKNRFTWIWTLRQIARFAAALYQQLETFRNIDEFVKVADFSCTIRHLPDTSWTKAEV